MKQSFLCCNCSLRIYIENCFWACINNIWHFFTVWTSLIKNFRSNDKSLTIIGGKNRIFVLLLELFSVFWNGKIKFLTYCILSSNLDRFHKVLKAKLAISLSNDITFKYHTIGVLYTYLFSIIKKTAHLAAFLLYIFQ